MEVEKYHSVSRKPGHLILMFQIYTTLPAPKKVMGGLFTYPLFWKCYLVPKPSLFNVCVQ